MKRQKKCKSRKKRYHAEATGKDKVIYDEIVRLLEACESVMDIHRKTGVARNTVYAVNRINLNKF